MTQQPEPVGNSPDEPEDEAASWRVETQPATGEVHVTQTYGPWNIEMRWPSGATQGGPASMTITSDSDAKLTSTVLRRIDFKGASKLFRSARTITVPQEIREFFDTNGPALRALLRRGLNDDYLAVLSATYVGAVQRGEPKITDYLCGLIKRRAPTVKAHLTEARRRGLLTPARGQAGGECTPRCLDLLSKITLFRHPHGKD